MKKLALLLLIVIAMPVAAWAETWKNVPLTDAMCAPKVKADPDKHTAQCMIQCAKSGFGILTADGTFLKFDQAGNEKAEAALKATKKKDHIRVTVEGERDKDTIKVKSLALDE